MGDVFKGIVETVANVFGAGPRGGPLGGEKDILGPVTAAALNFIPGVGPFLSAADFAAQAGGQFAKGNTLGGILDLGGAGLSGAGGLGAFGGGAGAGTGAAAASGAAGGVGSSLADFASSVGSGASNAWDSVLQTLGIGGGAAPAVDAATISGGATGSGFQDLIGSLGGSTGAASGAAAFDPALDAATISGGATGAGADLSGAGVGTAASGATGGAGNLNALLKTLGYSTPSSGAALAGTPTIGGAGGGGLLDTISSFSSAHPLLTTGAGLVGSQLLSPLMQKLQGSGLTSQEKNLIQSEQPAITAANQLIPSLETGNLPPGAEQSVDQALAADIAQIKQRYASTGQSGSAAEQTDIANAQSNSAAKKFGLAQEATNTGLSALGLNQSVYSTLVQDQLTRQQQLQNAFAGFFNALGLGTALKSAA